MPSSIKPIFLLLLLSLVTGCSLLSRQTSDPLQLSLDQRQQQLLAMQRFTLQATLSIKTPAESISGNLRWQQLHSEHFQARMANIMGMSLFELSQNELGSQLKLRGETYQAMDASSLLWQLAGWSMPLADMPLWLRGIPGKGAIDIQYDEQGRVKAFNLTDSTGIHWQLQYHSFFNDSLSLPRQMQLNSDDTQIRLVIRSWQ
ncbi:lipoprotein insertase outer membrane protein LolB [Arsukibacterium sp.]|uniref:lipoprotein insertase outer membrane protein LolB n=1 Tax=Arsukibacterium sp. TaxID=1977258 RepID=UPI002FDB84F4